VADSSKAAAIPLKMETWNVGRIHLDEDRVQRTQQWILWFNKWKGYFNYLRDYVASTSATSVNSCRTTRCNIPEDSHLNFHVWSTMTRPCPVSLSLMVPQIKFYSRRSGMAHHGQESNPGRYHALSQRPERLECSSSILCNGYQG
jgi:hypothetical protein